MGVGTRPSGSVEGNVCFFLRASHIAFLPSYEYSVSMNTVQLSLHTEARIVMPVFYRLKRVCNCLILDRETCLDHLKI